MLNYYRRLTSVYIRCDPRCPTNGTEMDAYSVAIQSITSFITAASIGYSLVKSNRPADRLTLSSYQTTRLDADYPLVQPHWQYIPAVKRVPLAGNTKDSTLITHHALFESGLRPRSNRRPCWIDLP